MCGGGVWFCSDKEPDTEDDAAPEKLSSEDKLRLWRVGQFARLGFSEASAGLLADSRADLHHTEDMVKHGCDLSVALRILI